MKVVMLGGALLLLGLWCWRRGRADDDLALPNRWLQAQAHRDQRTGEPTADEPGWWTRGYGPRWRSPKEQRLHRLADMRNKVREGRRA